MQANIYLKEISAPKKYYSKYKALTVRLLKINMRFMSQLPNIKQEIYKIRFSHFLIHRFKIKINPCSITIQPIFQKITLKIYLI